jgi:hypothetical protein
MCNCKKQPEITLPTQPATTEAPVPQTIQEPIIPKGKFNYGNDE